MANRENKMNERQEIAQTIIEFVKEFQDHPYNINNGLCDVFASELIEQLLKQGKIATQYWGDELPQFFNNKKYYPDAHCFVKCNGLYFDAEEPYGVTKPQLLPLFLRQLFAESQKRS